VGIILTLVGFALTFWRIRKLEKASVQARIGAQRLQDQIQGLESASAQARIASEHLRDQILKMNAVRDLGGAITTIDDMRRSPHLTPVQLLPDRYSSLKQELIALRGRIPDLSDQQRSTIQGAIQQISNVEEQIHNAVANGNAPALHRINEIIAKQVDHLSEILSDLKSQIDKPGH
jgi:phage shock protein A